MEELRLYRALYRFQIHCNHFTGNKYFSRVDPYRTPRYRHPYKQFLRSFPPWEVVEMACIVKYLFKRWTDLILDAAATTRFNKSGPQHGFDSNIEIHRAALADVDEFRVLATNGIFPPIPLQTWRTVD